MKRLLLFFIALAVVFASCKSTEVAADDAFAEDTVEEGTQESDYASGEMSDEFDDPTTTEDGDEAYDMAQSDEASDEEGDGEWSDELAEDETPETNEQIDLDEMLLQNAADKSQAARELKERIDSEGLAQYARNDYERGEEGLEKLNNLLADGTASPRELSAQAEETYRSYFLVYTKAYKKYANDARREAIIQKRRADRVRAQVSRNDDYTAYTDLIRQGDGHYATSNPERAFNCYKEAADSFTALADDVEEKRSEAQKAIDAARSKVQESYDYATSADSEKPLEEMVEGIEATDAVLLEDDDFGDPDEKVIYIEEQIDDAEGE